jgi:hypothetical protein
VIAALFLAAYVRADLPEQDRPDAPLILDECHLFLYLPFGVDYALSELRGGYIGLEMAEALRIRAWMSRLSEQLPQVLSTVDPEC